MEARVAPARRRHAAENDRLLAAGARHLIAARGLDGLSMSDLAAHTGLTRAPLYARYDSPEDVVVELWTSSVRATYDRVLEVVGRFFATDEDVPAELVAFVTASDEEHTVLVEILAAARRFPYVFEYVSESITEGLLRHLEERGETPASIALAQLSVTFGAAFTSPVLPHAGTGSWAETLPMVREHMRLGAARAVPESDVPTFRIPMPSAANDPDLVRLFVDAITQVLARTGYERASANRIARAAGRSFNSAYDVFASKDQLMRHAVVTLVEQMALLNFDGFVGLDEPSYVQLVAAAAASLFSDDNRTIRQIRIESFLAARHHEPIAEALRTLDPRAAERAEQLLDERYEGVTPEVMEHLLAFWTVLRSNVAGVCLLAPYLPRSCVLGWQPAAIAQYSFLRALVIDHLRPR